MPVRVARVANVDDAPAISDLCFDKRLSDWEALESRRADAQRLLEAWLWKSGLAETVPLITCLMGGTGTGKSTLFNSLAGEEVSQVGARRPCTLKAVVLAPENATSQLSACPFLDFGPGGNAELVVRDRDTDNDFILVDAPDFDSVEIANRTIAENLFVISDIILFVTSQEKYADLTAHQMAEEAKIWGKSSHFVMNKVTSEGAFHDFQHMLEQDGYEGEPIGVERLDPAPHLVPGLRERPSFRPLVHGRDESPEALREAELRRLSTQTYESLGSLAAEIEEQHQRIRRVEEQIDGFLQEVIAEMQHRLDAILSEDIETRVRQRLQNLLRKYDILFVPRMLVRNAVRTAFGSLLRIVTGRMDVPGSEQDEKHARDEDFEATRSAVNLKPVEAAAAEFNLKMAELLASDPSLDDLREVAREDVKRLGAKDVREQYDEAFPGVEHLLEDEFREFREGLSPTDELKLYGSYTLWALLLITAEIVVGGGFTLLDAILNTVIVPFIPKWLLNLKVLDVLREIGRRVDTKHREALNAIVKKQAQLYVTAFRNLLPDERTTETIRSLMLDLDCGRN